MVIMVGLNIVLDVDIIPFHIHLIKTDVQAVEENIKNEL